MARFKTWEDGGCEEDEQRHESPTQVTDFSTAGDDDKDDGDSGRQLAGGVLPEDHTVREKASATGEGGNRLMVYRTRTTDPQNNEDEGQDVVW